MNKEQINDQIDYLTQSLEFKKNAAWELSWEAEFLYILAKVLILLTLYIVNK